MEKDHPIGYIVISNSTVEEVTILSVTRDFCTVRFTSWHGGTRLRKSRVFATKEDALGSIKPAAEEWTPGQRRKPEDWL